MIVVIMTTDIINNSNNSSNNGVCISNAKLDYTNENHNSNSIEINVLYYYFTGMYDEIAWCLFIVRSREESICSYTQTKVSPS